MASLPRATRSLDLLQARLMLLCLAVLSAGLVFWALGDDMEAIDASVELHADRVHALWTDETYQCLGWRATANCNPHGWRKPSRDRGCSDAIEAGMSGYCEIRNRTSGEIFHVMLTACDSIKGKSFTCMEARDFSDYSIRAASAPAVSLSTPVLRTFANVTNGIVMSIYPSVLPNVYAIVRMLRFYNCQLPMELWYEPHQMPGVATNPILVALEANYGPLVLRPIHDKRATGYMTKPFAVAHSQFENVLFLDSDNLPTRDPTFLFTSPQFLASGAIFWPDYWHDMSSPFNVHARSLLWELVDMPFVDMLEQESGQLVIARHRCATALAKVLHYALETPPLLQKYGLVWGDKDLFRLAWLNTSTPFAFVPHPPALGGFTKDEYVDAVAPVPSVLYWHAVSFCGIAMLQHDFDGRILFVHRNSVKLTGEADQTPLVTHAQTSTLSMHSSPLLGHGKAYFIQLFGHTLGQKACYLLTSAGKIEAVDAIDDSMAKVEKMAIHYAIEAGDMLRAVARRRKELGSGHWLLPFDALDARHSDEDAIPVMYWVTVHMLVGGLAGWTWRRRQRLGTKGPTKDRAMPPPYQIL
ncbi:hypothetical protein SPRG_02308 [Saprolegnia parasitica CBS 223.65]|uniref:Uncharacterized protein n=1 Tax=Saprolegnia parasitica (strain CBS 223.65) TaxID=695850 RepID=A0A067CW53_SAPPC|nr:hypothetical protein SPRG_02308 [Saprolegnia parasitica CBS 223.65]KDO33500.1 hypothetical protein SPRG_02308 [Saprolegnia parasitica CBS 223.65]|eukprot:XP_012196243.1 hypothetical protein SPRG_02308 [Saprolegnia parasitica CBS 223.65]